MSETAVAPIMQGDIVSLTEKDIREYIAPNATKKEVFMFLNICRSYGLNPFKREIHFVKYGDKPGQTIVGYETYLKRAESTGKLDGWKCWVEDDKAKVVIFRNDRKYPFEWEVDRKEFDKKQSTWTTMPNFMLKKVCLAQAFRLCFPQEMGGMPYIPEEIGVQHNGETVEPEKAPSQPPQPPSSPKTTLVEIQDVIRDIAKGRKVTPAEVVKELGYETTAKIPHNKYDEVRGKLTDMLNDLIKTELDAEEI